ncbi:DrmB family protein [Vibrio casei]|uniref:DrmB family protein n=1 Tax=Vibrio casei TaxID=673372 RepID=UPI003F94F7BE
MNKKLTAIRLSHIASQQGVGSITLLENDYTGVIVDTRYWYKDGIPDLNKELKNVRRIQRCLEIPQQLYLPPTGSGDDELDIESAIPGVLFPNYLQCNKCGQLNLNPWENNPHKSTSKPRCSNSDCNGVMQQGTYCVVDNFGHLDDVSWNYLCHHPYAHDKKQPIQTDEKCKTCYSEHHKNKLRIIFDKGRQKLECTECKSSIWFEPSKTSLKPMKPQPWIYEKLPKDPDGLKRKSEVVEINHPSVYSPVNLDGLVIPPESNNNEVNVGTADVLKYSDDLDEVLNAPSDFLRKRKAEKLTHKLGVTLEVVLDALKLYESGSDDEETELIGTPGQMKEEEYEAFTTEQEFSPSADFKTRHLTEFLDELRDELSNELKTVSYIVKDLVKVERLRKVQVFHGFLRSHRDLDPENNAAKKSQDQENKDKYEPQIVQPNIVGDAEWLPAINLYGEGIFITLDPSWLRAWASNHSIASRASELSRHYEESESQLQVEGSITPEFLLLHTLSHLVIRELEDKCGYPASSLSERLYSSREAGICGFLIYTAVADKSGSLGGLMELAEPKSFLAILDSAIKRAYWCTLDPVCSDHGGQGRDGLNRAACHGCTLVPDTSCDYGNVFLDRVLIKGDKSHGIPSLLDFIRDNHL